MASGKEMVCMSDRNRGRLLGLRPSKCRGQNFVNCSRSNTCHDMHSTPKQGMKRGTGCSWKGDSENSNEDCSLQGGDDSHLIARNRKRRVECLLYLTEQQMQLQNHLWSSQQQRCPTKAGAWLSPHQIRELVRLLRRTGRPSAKPGSCPSAYVVVISELSALRVMTRRRLLLAGARRLRSLFALAQQFDDLSHTSVRGPGAEAAISSFDSGVVDPCPLEAELSRITL